MPLLRRLVVIFMALVAWIAYGSPVQAQSVLEAGTDSLRPRVLGAYQDAAGANFIRLRAAEGGLSPDRVGYTGLFQLASQQLQASQRNRPREQREVLREEDFANANPCDLMYVCRIPRDRATGRPYRQFIMLNGRQSNGEACAYNRRNFPEIGNEFVSRSFLQTYCTNHGGSFYEIWDRPREIYNVPMHIAPTAHDLATTALREIGELQVRAGLALPELARELTPRLHTVLTAREAQVDPATSDQEHQALRSSIVALERVGQSNVTVTASAQRSTASSQALASAEEQNQRLASQLSEERLARARDQQDARDHLRDARAISFLVLLALAVVFAVMLRRQSLAFGALRDKVFVGFSAASRKGKSLHQRLEELLSYEVLVIEYEGIWNGVGKTIINYLDSKTQMPIQEEVNLFVREYGMFNVPNLRSALNDMRMCLEARVSKVTGKIASPYLAPASSLARTSVPNRPIKSNGNLIADEANAKEVAELSERLHVCQDQLADLRKEHEKQVGHVAILAGSLGRANAALRETISKSEAEQLMKQCEDLAKANRSLSQSHMGLTEQLKQEAAKYAQASKLLEERRQGTLQAGERMVRKFNKFIEDNNGSFMSVERELFSGLSQELVSEMKRMEKPEVVPQELALVAPSRSTIPASGFAPSAQRKKPLPSMIIDPDVATEQAADTDSTESFFGPQKETLAARGPVAAARTRGASESGTHTAAKKSPNQADPAVEDSWDDAPTKVAPIPSASVKIPSIPPHGKGSKGT